MLDAFEREEPSATWAQFRSLVDVARGVSQLRSIVNDLRGAAAGLSSAARSALERDLRMRFGADKEFERLKEVATKARARGRIRSEREYRDVQAYADGIAGDLDADAEHDALGALLDGYMATG